MIDVGKLDLALTLINGARTGDSGNQIILLVNPKIAPADLIVSLSVLMLHDNEELCLDNLHKFLHKQSLESLSGKSEIAITFPFKTKHDRICFFYRNKGMRISKTFEIEK